MQLKVTNLAMGLLLASAAPAQDAMDVHQGGVTVSLGDSENCAFEREPIEIFAKGVGGFKRGASFYDIVRRLTASAREVGADFIFDVQISSSPDSIGLSAEAKAAKCIGQSRDKTTGVLPRSVVEAIQSADGCDRFIFKNRADIPAARSVSDAAPVFDKKLDALTCDKLRKELTSQQSYRGGSGIQGSCIFWPQTGIRLTQISGQPLWMLVSSCGTATFVAAEADWSQGTNFRLQNPVLHELLGNDTLPEH